MRTWEELGGVWMGASEGGLMPGVMIIVRKKVLFLEQKRGGK